MIARGRANEKREGKTKDLLTMEPKKKKKDRLKSLGVQVVCFWQDRHRGVGQIRVPVLLLVQLIGLLVCDIRALDGCLDDDMVAALVVDVEHHPAGQHLSQVNSDWVLREGAADRRTIQLDSLSKKKKKCGTLKRKRIWYQWVFWA